MDFNKVDASRIKFEARVAEPPESPSGGSKFGRFLRSFGALAAPVGFASAFFFPPAALVGATSYGLAQFGGYRDGVKRREPNSKDMPSVYFPGVTSPAGGPASPTTSLGGPNMGGSAGSGIADPMNVILNRQAAMNDMIGQVR
ncbi:MAG: hypothetical protein HY542_02865 [Deltaproteobacteria bacterium]|nr:hypothetical protein [Deltaproteobacteria bacterium]